jgi:hypothetical protein
MTSILYMYIYPYIRLAAHVCTLYNHPYKYIVAHCFIIKVIVYHCCNDICVVTLYINRFNLKACMTEMMSKFMQKEMALDKGIYIHDSAFMIIWQTGLTVTALNLHTYCIRDASLRAVLLSMKTAIVQQLQCAVVEGY